MSNTPPKPVTQKQIAQALNVSQSLVALALKGHPSVAEATRLRVEATAKEMGYEPTSNVAARTMVARRYGTKVQTGQVAVLMSDFMDGFSLQDMPFFREILQGIHDAAGKQDIDISMHVVRAGNLPRVVTSGSVDGVICLYNFVISGDLRRLAPDVPAIRLGHSFQAEEWGIAPDNEAGALAATRHLLELGHRRIAFLGSRDVWPISVRYQAFRAALREFGLEPDPGLVFGAEADPSHTTGYEETSSLLSRRRDFTALVCNHDSVAFGAIQAARESGLRVPEDLSVTGFDGAQGFGYGSSGQLTTVYFDRRIMGRRAIAMLNEINTGSAVPRQDQLPIRLLVRQTTAAPQSVAVPTA